jgi:hypothetical protein
MRPLAHAPRANGTGTQAIENFLGFPKTARRHPSAKEYVLGGHAQICSNVPEKVKWAGVSGKAYGLRHEAYGRRSVGGWRRSDKGCRRAQNLQTYRLKTAAAPGAERISRKKVSTNHTNRHEKEDGPVRAESPDRR